MGNRLEYMQDGPIHFRMLFCAEGTVEGGMFGPIQRALEANGMIAVVGLNGNSGWAYAREIFPLWHLPASQRLPVQLIPITDEHRAELVLQLYSPQNPIILNRGEKNADRRADKNKTDRDRVQQYDEPVGSSVCE